MPERRLQHARAELPADYQFPVGPAVVRMVCHTCGHEYIVGEYLHLPCCVASAEVFRSRVGLDVFARFQNRLLLGRYPYPHA